MDFANRQTVTVINELTQADIWILPQTPENLKTTLWGTATAAKLATGEHRVVPLCKAGENGCYLLRAIDTDGFYYSANNLLFEPGYTLRLQGEALLSVTAEVTDENGVCQNRYDMFSARL